MEPITVIRADAHQHGAERENIFHALNGQGAYLGSLLIYPYIDEDIEPEHPHNLYLHLHAEPGKTLSREVKDALLTHALLRAKEIKKDTQQTKTRVTTSFLKDQHDEIAYFLQRGFTHDEGMYIMERWETTELSQAEDHGEYTIQPWELATKAEQQQFIGIHRTIFPRHAYRMESLQELKTKPGWKNFTAYAGKEIAGNIMVYEKQSLKNTGFIEDLFVLRPYRHGGIGRRLMHTALVYFQERGIHRVQLELWSANKSAFKLYQVFAFTKIDEPEIAVGLYV